MRRAVWALLLIGCARPSALAAAAPPGAATPQVEPAAGRPMKWPVRATLSLRAHDQRDGVIHEQLEARIETDGPLAVPIEVELELPDGVALVAGRARLSLPPGTREHTEVYALERTGRPAQDLRLRVDVEGGNFGVHFRVPHDFGRPVPPAPLSPRGSDLKIGEHSLGRSIRVEP